METLVITACIAPKSVGSEYLGCVHAKSNDKKTLNTIERYQIYKENLLFYF
ncbi:MAG: hypothetical protein LBG80_16290 [Bacteroidales bacterium]|nr:hypothetical protein [Bacteroidales bacterium]